MASATEAVSRPAYRPTCCWSRAIRPWTSRQPGLYARSGKAAWKSPVRWEGILSREDAEPPNILPREDTQSGFSPLPSDWTLTDRLVPKDAAYRSASARLGGGRYRLEPNLGKDDK